MRSVVFASHVAYLDDVTGCGVLVRPKPSDDIAPPFPGQSLHEADWNALIRLLDDDGWEPIEDEDSLGLPCIEGYTRDGKQIIVLSGRDPHVTGLDLDEVARSFAELHELAGLVSIR